MDVTINGIVYEKVHAVVITDMPKDTILIDLMDRNYITKKSVGLDASKVEIHTQAKTEEK